MEYFIADEEKALAYLKRNILKCRLKDLEELTPKYFDVTYSYLVSELHKLKLQPSVDGFASFIIQSILVSSYRA